MRVRVFSPFLCLLVAVPALLRAQEPIFRVTVLEKTMPAVNYGHRSLPTKIDFRGTVLYPEAAGRADVEAKAGLVEIDAKFSGLGTPARFGREYLTYVLWAVTPDGRAQALGELVTNSGDKSKLRATTRLQTFGLMVTAEPHYAVTHPSGVVVLQNAVRPDTVGTVEQVTAKYELLPRESVTLDLEDARARAGAPAPMVSQKEYEALLALYEAQNAVQIAQSWDAGRYATDTMQRAEELLDRARQLKDQNADSKTVVMTARQAAQTAEDARSIAIRRREEHKAASGSDTGR
jgi:hypothetical protein